MSNRPHNSTNNGSHNIAYIVNPDIKTENIHLPSLGIEFDTNAIGWMSVQCMDEFKFWIATKSEN